MSHNQLSQTSGQSAARRRRMFLARVAAVAIILAVAVLRPKLEGWLSGPDGAGAVVVEDGQGTIPLSPATADSPPVIIRDINEAPAAESADPPGKLTLVSGTRDRFRSSAGLLYLPGSADGHRLKHILRHSADDPDKPVHGVYTGDRDQILAWIDMAFERGRKGGRGTRRRNENGRTVYTVDLGQKIGYVGGQTGKRKNHPPCRFLRLVVENDDEVVTAYPTQSL